MIRLRAYLKSIIVDMVNHAYIKPKINANFIIHNDLNRIFDYIH